MAKRRSESQPRFPDMWEQGFREIVQSRLPSLCPSYRRVKPLESRFPGLWGVWPAIHGESTVVIFLEPIRSPFPNISSHIESAIGAGAFGIAAHRCGETSAVIYKIPAKTI